MAIRAFYQAAKVDTAKPPLDTLHLKITYPAKILDSDMENNFGVFPADDEKAPFPVVVFMNGFNCGAEMYNWLAIALAQRDLVVVTYNWITDDFPGMVNLSPGVNTVACQPANQGSMPTALALPTILDTLKNLQTSGILARKLDLNKIILGGHSAGGRIALESSNLNFFPQLAAVFSYGASSSGISTFGYEPGTILPLPNSIPTLLMGGTCDGVISNFSQLNGNTLKHPTVTIARTFTEAIAGGRNDSYLLLLEGANHFAITYPLDNTVGVGFLDFPATKPEDQTRTLMAEAIALFIDTHVRNCSSALESLNQLLDLNNPLIYAWERK